MEISDINKKTIKFPIAPYKPEKLQAVFVAGNSMTGVNINDGDVAVYYPRL